MHSTNADFGRRLVSTKVPATGGFAWIGSGVLLLGLAAFTLLPLAATQRWRSILPGSAAIPCSAAALAAAAIAVGGRRFRSGSAQHFHENGACFEQGGRRQATAYGDAEAVTFVVRTAGDRVERLLTFSGPGGRPAMYLASDLADGDAGDGRTPCAADAQNVASRVIKAVAARTVERVDRGEVVKWTDRLWLDQAGIRLDDAAGGKLVPWNVIDGVKDGSKSGRIEVYAFGSEQPVAAAMTHEANALPGFQAFMHLLDRGQAAARAA